jgi:hypothetical protein
MKKPLFLLLLISGFAFGQNSSNERIRDHYYKIIGKPTIIAPTKPAYSIDRVNRQVWRSLSTTQSVWTLETDTAVINLLLSRGEKGDAGPQGPQGIQGPKGDPGAQGFRSNRRQVPGQWDRERKYKGDQEQQGPKASRTSRATGNPRRSPHALRLAAGQVVHSSPLTFRMTSSGSTLLATDRL